MEQPKEIKLIVDESDIFYNQLPVLGIYNASDNPSPSFAYEGDSGLDICAHLEHDKELSPHTPFICSTGIYLAIPEGYEVQVRTRSGMAANGVQVLNSPGTIDEKYTGEIKVILNAVNSGYKIANGDRIAQLVLKKKDICTIRELDKSDFEAIIDSKKGTDRGDKGFGSSGK